MTSSSISRMKMTITESSNSNKKVNEIKVVQSSTQRPTSTIILFMLTRKNGFYTHLPIWQSFGKQFLYIWPLGGVTLFIDPYDQIRYRGENLSPIISMISSPFKYTHIKYP